MQTVVCPVQNVPSAADRGWHHVHQKGAGGQTGADPVLGTNVITKYQYPVKQLNLFYACQTKNCRYKFEENSPIVFIRI